jgi:hypothetical protein
VPPDAPRGGLVLAPGAGGPRFSFHIAEPDSQPSTTNYRNTGACLHRDALRGRVWGAGLGRNPIWTAVYCAVESLEHPICVAGRAKKLGLITKIQSLFRNDVVIDRQREVDSPTLSVGRRPAVMSGWPHGLAQTSSPLKSGKAESPPMTASLEMMTPSPFRIVSGDWR